MLDAFLYKCIAFDCKSKMGVVVCWYTLISDEK